jgi:hypothetical protein
MQSFPGAFGEAEVREPDFLLFVDEEVGGFEVAVQDVVLVSKVHGGGGLPHPFGDFSETAFRDTAATEQSAGRVAGGL